MFSASWTIIIIYLWDNFYYDTEVRLVFYSEKLDMQGYKPMVQGYQDPRVGVGDENE